MNKNNIHNDVLMKISELINKHNGKFPIKFLFNELSEKYNKIQIRRSLDLLSKKTKDINGKDIYPKISVVVDEYVNEDLSDEEKIMISVCVIHTT